jgi:hypothetical protein
MEGGRQHSTQVEGGRNSEVRYRIEDVEAFEKSNRFTTDNK